VLRISHSPALSPKRPAYSLRNAHSVKSTRCIRLYDHVERVTISPSNHDLFDESLYRSVSDRAGIRRIKGLFHHTHRHRNAVEHIMHPEHTRNLPRIRRTTLKIRPQLPVFPPMAVLRPAATLSKPFLVATWVKQCH